jgi:hypothetical protein
LNCKLPKNETYNNFISEETREKMSKWQIGRKMSIESRIKMSKAALGKTVSEKTKQTAKLLNSIPILQYSFFCSIIK